VGKRRAETQGDAYHVEFDHRPHIEDLALTRRELLGRLGNGFAGLSLLGMLASEAEPPKQSGW